MHGRISVIYSYPLRSMLLCDDRLFAGRMGRRGSWKTSTRDSDASRVLESDHSAPQSPKSSQKIEALDLFDVLLTRDCIYAGRLTGVIFVI